MKNLKELPLNHDIAHLDSALALHAQAGGNFNCALDGGAHQGIWTRRMLQMFHEVVAIEPMPQNFKELPHDHKDLKAINAALGNHTGGVWLLPGPENTGQYHIDPEITQAGQDTPETTPLIAIDNLALDVDFLKLDVEGYEIYAIHGALETIERCRPSILVEINGLTERYGHTDAELHQAIIDCGYRHVKRWNKDHLFMPI